MKSAYGCCSLRVGCYVTAALLIVEVLFGFIVGGISYYGLPFAILQFGVMVSLIVLIIIGAVKENQQIMLAWVIVFLVYLILYTLLSIFYILYTFTREENDSTLIGITLTILFFVGLAIYLLLFFIGFYYYQELKNK